MNDPAADEGGYETRNAARARESRPLYPTWIDLKNFCELKLPQPTHS